MPPGTTTPLSRGWAADASPAGLAALSADGVVLYANPAMERMLGAAEGQLVGLDAAALHTIPELALAMARDRRSGDLIQGLELALTGLDGREVSVRIAASILEDGPAGAALVATVEDITTLRARESSEHQARTMDAVGRLAGGMAHHFNNLLASILGQVSLLKTSLNGEVDLIADVEAIGTAAGRAREIADLLLIVSGKEVGNRQRLDLSDWIYRTAAELQRQLPNDVELVVRAQSGSHEVRMDAGRLQQIMVGLVQNANEALPGGGTIVLEVGPYSSQNGDEAHLFSPPLIRGDYACITLADNGMGMNEETLARALEPFFSTRRDREGAGLGLATIYGITVQSGGHLSIESAPVVGTRVRILLPLINGQNEAAIPAVPEAASLLAEGWSHPVTLPGAAESGQGQEAVRPGAPARVEVARGRGDSATGDPSAPPSLTILVADDEETIRQVMVKILSRAGFNVLTAVDGRDARRILQERMDEISMLVTDVMMPFMNGVELVEWLRTQTPEMPHLMVSGFAGSPLVQKWVDQDPNGFMAKPFDAPEFLARVQDRLTPAGRP